MALARLVCGDCGAVVGPTDVFCAACGAKIEHGVPPPDAAKCSVCGHRNKGGGDHCESCGARLPGRRATEPPPERKSQAVPRKEATTRRRFEPWQLISAVAVVALLVYLITIQVSGDKPQAQAPGRSLAPSPMPNAASGAVSAAALAQLEQAVQAAPNDAAALLRLANALHDNGMLPRAIDAYGKYLVMRPQDPDARTDMGICYFQMSQADSTNALTLLKQAAREMETSLKYSPRHQPSAFNLGVVNIHMGNIDESNKWFRKAVEINKDSDLGIRAQTILTQHSFPQ